jgi:hypothetical protein
VGQELRLFKGRGSGGSAPGNGRPFFPAGKISMADIGVNEALELTLFTLQY